jgi:hypothetical protein
MKHYLCALSLKHANNTAMDWGWKRTGELKWTNKQGEEVHYISRKQQLDSIRDCILYLGWGWFQNTELGNSGCEFNARAIARNIKLKYTGD